MLKVLISLVILFLVKFVNPVFAKNLVILLPEPKPKIILNLSKKNEGLILPQKKPIIKSKHKLTNSSCSLFDHTSNELDMKANFDLKSDKDFPTLGTSK